jgi:hypothetical protein
MNRLLEKIRIILRDRRVRRMLTRTISVFSAIIVFVTTYALILPAITVEKQAACGIEEHQHTEDCYEKVLICDLPESEGHQHTDGCYSVKSVLSCDVPEHVHDEDCYDENGYNIRNNDKTCWINIRCTIEERQEIIEMAKERGMTVADFIRYLVAKERKGMCNRTPQNDEVRE